MHSEIKKHQRGTRPKVRTHGFGVYHWAKSGGRRKRARHLHSVPFPASLARFLRSSSVPHGSVADAAVAAQAPSPRLNRPTTETRAQKQAQAVILTAREGAAERRRLRVTVFKPMLRVFTSAVRCPVRRRRRRRRQMGIVAPLCRLCLIQGCCCRC